jgi:sulfite dehydrogenase
MATRPAFATALLMCVLLAAGCGGKGHQSSSGSTSSLPGAKVFSSAGCGGCHTLQAAKSKGTVGPDLDQLRPDAQTVQRQVRNGGVGMPSFSKKLNEVQISQVAEFVSESTRSSTMGGSVAAGFKPDDTKIADCKPTDFHCFEQAFANISYNDGPKTALDKFDQDIKTPGPIERDCHRIAHAIGAGALSHFHGNIGQAFVAGRPSCTSGYYHGILERAFLGVPQGQLGAKARQFCASPIVRKSEFIAYQCVHGLGH